METSPNSSSKVQCQGREPILAAVLSFIFMGMGQAYNGQRRKGYLFIASYVALAALYIILLKIFHEPIPKSTAEVQYTSFSYIITALCSLIIWIYNIYDAYKWARKINDDSIAVDSTPGRSVFIFLRSVILVFLIFVVLIIVLTILTFLLRGKGSDPQFRPQT